MHEAILYCDMCGHIITPAARSKAVIGPDACICPACADNLSPKERSAFEIKAHARQDHPDGRPVTESTRLRSAAITSARPKRSPVPIMVICGATTGILVGVVVGLATASGPKPQSQRVLPALSAVPSRPANATVRPAAPTAPSTPATTEKKESKARVRLNEIDSWRNAELTSYARMREALSGFPSDFPEAPEIADAENLLARIDKGYSRQAEDALAAAKAEAMRLAEQGNYKEAEARILSVGRLFPDGEWLSSRGRGLIAEAQKAIEKKRLDEITGVVDRAQKAVSAGELAIARQALKDTTDWPDDLSRRAAAVIEQADERERAIRAKEARLEAWHALLKGSAQGRSRRRCASQEAR